MVDTHETVADIIAEGRRMAENETEADILAEMRESGEVARFYADRLEAAHKRERGDCAKLREALVSLRDAVRDFRHQTVYTKYNDIMDEYTCREKGIPAVLALRNAIPKANLALAAPPRNCDRYNDRVEMYGVFKDWCNARGHTMEPKLAYDAFEWLLATATEKEGGAK